MIVVYETEKFTCSDDVLYKYYVGVFMGGDCVFWCTVVGIKNEEG